MEYYKSMDHYTSVGKVSVSTGMTGKMEGVQSISTIESLNPFCRQSLCNLEGPNCKHCYANRTLALCSGLRKNLESNYKLLTTELLSKEDARCIRFTSVIARIESFGDVANLTQARNYIRIVRANGQVRFAAWTKTPAIWDEALALEGKPRNLSMVLSSRNMNTVAEDYEKFAWVDYVFTVYDRQWLSKNNGNSWSLINCGGMTKCMECQQCYKRHRGGVRFINEVMR